MTLGQDSVPGRDTAMCLLLALSVCISPFNLPSTVSFFIIRTAVTLGPLVGTHMVNYAVCISIFSYLAGIFITVLCYVLLDVYVMCASSGPCTPQSIITLDDLNSYFITTVVFSSLQLVSVILTAVWYFLWRYEPLVVQPSPDRAGAEHEEVSVGVPLGVVVATDHYMNAERHIVDASFSLGYIEGFEARQHL